MHLFCGPFDVDTLSLKNRSNDLGRVSARPRREPKHYQFVPKRHDACMIDREKRHIAQPVHVRDLIRPHLLVSSADTAPC